MLSVWDDHPVHQTSQPVLHPVSGDPSFYERYYGGLFDLETETHVGLGLSLHPNRDVIDAAFSIARDGHQESLFASGPCPTDRAATVVGPFRLEVLEPMRSLRVIVEPTDGLGAEITFAAQSPAIEEQRLIRTAGAVTVSDRTRFVQFGNWTGRLLWRGQELDCAGWPGVRDRSWGVRRQGAATEPGRPPGSIYAVWSVLHFDDGFLQVTIHEDEEGRGFVRSGIEFPRLTAAASPIADVATVRRTDAVVCEISYRPGTRRPAAARLGLGPRGGLDLSVALEPRATFQMKGLGYYHPTRAQGSRHDSEPVRRESWRVDELDPVRAENVHAQQLCVAQRGDGLVGLGIFEHVAIGMHRPSGLPAGTGR